MSYKYHTQLESLWKKAVSQYEAGQRGSETYFTEDEAQWLASNGLTPQEIYDFAEDFVTVGDPDFTTFAMITDVRRSYFLNEMKGEKSGKTIDPSTYPPKDSEVDGIRWLPRIIGKARAKLRGELDADTMYSCGGDRKFLKENDIHPAQFLNVVANHFDDDKAIIGWVKKHIAKS
ncbi:DUF5069 domain-containing protein [Cerasicoccus arenae]|uniref:DUF5069 domain-containing protein n=1 Tax=Cerasicoccus arenae TaxID=424488 RepID=A0A8J3D9X3_9BACT|nr:DUF5069 domain-containing protein [Cerasicoccus arenae]MBK1857214.1 DUF5069 domain-containing protein [Cerasicoccus arenae]GHC00042.1 hypothetical protein GCM10007047_15340 [Cerasicoccus arenae]